MQHAPPGGWRWWSASSRCNWNSSACPPRGLCPCMCNEISRRWSWQSHQLIEIPSTWNWNLICQIWMLLRNMQIYVSCVTENLNHFNGGKEKDFFFCFDPAFKVTYIGCPVLDLNYKVYFIYLVVCLTTFTCIFTKTDNWKNKIIIIKCN